MSRKSCMESIRGVCRRCGGPLTAGETEDNAGNLTCWAFCPECQRLDWGVKPFLQRAARILVEDGFVAYRHLERPDRSNEGELERWKRDQTQGAVSVVARARLAVQQARLQLGLTGE